MSFAKLVIVAGMIAHFQSGGSAPSTPEVRLPPVREAGIATTYGFPGGYYGERTANGDEFRPRERATCAHRELPLGTWVIVEYPRTGNYIWCPITDRGPYVIEDPDGSRHVTTPADPPDRSRGESWSGVLDVSIRAMERLHHDVRGKFRVRIRYWPDRVDLDAGVALGTGPGGRGPG